MLTAEGIEIILFLMEELSRGRISCSLSRCWIFSLTWPSAAFNKITAAPEQARVTVQWQPQWTCSSSTPESIRRSVSWRLREVILSLYRALVGHTCSTGSSSGLPSKRGNMDILERVQQRATKVNKWEEVKRNN